MADPALWSNQERAKTLLQDRERLLEKVHVYDALKARWTELLEMTELAREENDEALERSVASDAETLVREARRLKLTLLFSGEADKNDCFLEIHAGAGGTEAQDWTQMMMRMYCRWAEQKGYGYAVVEESAGEEAGIKSVVLKISARGKALHPYGWLKRERGVHRLVRISPFDSNARRHTSFAAVWVYPEVDDRIQVNIEEKDLRVDTYRASGAGGQHVNKTESAIRITHVPTNTVVSCQTDRSQHRNRAQAMEMLKSKLYALELSKQEAALETENASKTDNGWGNQIRSYVLQPYQMVKDAVSGFECGNAAGVLEGDHLQDFLDAALERAG